MCHPGNRVALWNQGKKGRNKGITMKKLLVILLCLMAVFVIVSCKEEPEDQGGGGSGSGAMYYHLVATETAKRFGFRYSGIEIEPGDELTFKYRSDHPVTHLYLRDASGTTGVSQKAIDEYIEDAGDGWISFSFVFEETLDGMRLELANYLKPETGEHDAGKGKFEPGDYLDIMDLAINGQILEIKESDDGQSNQGVWNNTNTDHVHPTLEIKYL